MRKKNALNNERKINGKMFFIRKRENSGPKLVNSNSEILRIRIRKKPNASFFSLIDCLVWLFQNMPNIIIKNQYLDPVNSLKYWALLGQRNSRPFFSQMLVTSIKLGYFFRFFWANSCFFMFANYFGFLEFVFLQNWLE